MVLLVGMMIIASKNYDAGNSVVEKQTTDSVRGHQITTLNTGSGTAEEAYREQAPELTDWFKHFEPQIGKFGAEATFKGINWVRLDTGYLFPELTPDRTLEHIALRAERGQEPVPCACGDYLDGFDDSLEVQAGELWPNVYTGKTDEAVMADPVLSAWYKNPTFNRKIYILPVSVANSDGTSRRTVPYNEMNVKARWRQTFTDIEFLPTVALDSDYVNHVSTHDELIYILSLGASRGGIAPELDAFYQNLPKLPDGLVVPFFMTGAPLFVGNVEGSTGRISRGYGGSKGIQIWQVNHTIETTDFAMLIVHELGHRLFLRHPGDRALVPLEGGGPETGTSNVMNPIAGTYFSFTNYNLPDAMFPYQQTQVEWITSYMSSVPITPHVSLEPDGMVRLIFPYPDNSVWSLQASTDMQNWNTISTSADLDHAIGGVAKMAGTHRLFFTPSTTNGFGQYFRVQPF